MTVYEHLISAILKGSEDLVALPPSPPIPASIQSFCDKVLADCISEIGAASETDGFKSSRDRYFAMTAMALIHLPAGARIAVGYAAPGHLALALQLAGYDVSLIDPNDAWVARYEPKDIRSRIDAEIANFDQPVLPFKSQTVDCFVLTGAFERLLVNHPRNLLREVHRVLGPNGIIICSTPNICNISNIVSILQGNNIFWSPDIFYGGTDRHNREFTPREIRDLFESNGFQTRAFFGMNDHANWRTGSAQHIYDYQGKHGTPDHSLMRNTIIGVFRKTST
jgi:2-polyprenyl-3-methyl-5-hydroxy-6-metoxy-1,4-benzoquinol methylase